MKIEIGGITTVQNSIDSASKAVMHSAIVGVTKALQRALELSRGMLSETDHTQADLDAMGHPYAKRNPQDIHGGLPIVHAQSGDYIDALRVSRPTSDSKGIVGGDVHIGAGQEQLDEYIQKGTMTMVARPWAQDIVDHDGDELSQIVQAEVEVALAREALAS